MNNRREVLDHEVKLVWLKSGIYYCFTAFIFWHSFSWYQNAELKATFNEIDDLKKQEKSRQQRILKTKEDLAAAEKELEDLQPYEQPKAEMVSWLTLLHYILLSLHLFSFSLWFTAIMFSLWANSSSISMTAAFTLADIFLFLW